MDICRKAHAKNTLLSMFCGTTNCMIRCLCCVALRITMYNASSAGVNTLNMNQYDLLSSHVSFVTILFACILHAVSEARSSRRPIVFCLFLVFMQFVALHLSLLISFWSLVLGHDMKSEGSKILDSKASGRSVQAYENPCLWSCWLLAELLGQSSATKVQPPCAGRWFGLGMNFDLNQ